MLVFKEDAEIFENQDTLQIDASGGWLDDDDKEDVSKVNIVKSQGIMLAKANMKSIEVAKMMGKSVAVPHFYNEADMNLTRINV